ncbi:MAG: nicotinate-nucleotide--dimethylbenzimidazole phosphoribosyltransferase, partial [Dehalococcoidia bacterium]|nr:nicotinate-nucleotide--dimethylbenzimidazole phosphoribosyltransferase [Dehalococcoidia bacterium]
MSDLEQLIGPIAPLDEDAMERARQRQARLTKPPGSLGRLEGLSLQLAGISGCSRAYPRRAVVLAVGDHGVAEEGVSPYPQSVTAQMVANFLRGGAAINVLARGASCDVLVVDVGVVADLPAHPRLLARKIARSTR